IRIPVKRLSNPIPPRYSQHVGRRGGAGMANCPICKREVEAIDPGIFDGEAYHCRTHGEFAVANTVFAVSDYLNANESWWEVALKKATLREAGNRPKILTYDFMHNS